MDIHQLVEQDLVAMRRKVLEQLKANHVRLFSVVEAWLAGRKNRFGMEVLENGQVAGRYTFLLDGVHIAEVERDRLYSEVNHPLLGVVRPYIVIEKRILEEIIEDERFFEELFPTVREYMPKMTIRFLPD